MGPLEGAETGQAEPPDDPWSNWTVEIYADGSADFESRQESFDTRYGVFVARVTEDWKIQLRPFFNYNYDRFERDDWTITSTSRRDGVTSYVVRSISPHWSIGAFGDVFTSMFDNVDLRYRRSTTRRSSSCRFAVPARPRTLQRPVRGGLEVRVMQGLSVEVGGQLALIHNQLNLPKGDADLEEVLLRRRQLETNYRAGLNFGLRYRFGSIFNNVVNTRFGGRGGQDRF